jgi:hypothetical protein
VGIVFVAVETMVYKAVLIPWFISDTIKKNTTKREVEPSVYNIFFFGEYDPDLCH